MNVIINDENLTFDNESSLNYIIQNLKIENKIMAASVNMNIIKKDKWKNFIVKENDKIELLQFVGGG